MQDIDKIIQVDSLNLKKPLKASSLESLKTFIHSNYLQVKYMLPPETRKWLFSSKSANHLLISSSLITKLLNPDQISDCEPSHPATCISGNLLKCWSCSSPSEEIHKVSSQAELHDFYLNSIKHLEVGLLTKFEYNLSFLSLPSHAKYIHIQNILTRRTIQSFRCCTCCDVLSVGKKTGVKTSCNHFTCISCSISQQSQRCKLCNQQFDLMPTYLDNPRLTDLTCSASEVFHSLVTTKGKVFKLICGHLACESHLKSETCSTCGFLFKNSFKICEKSEDFRKFLRVFCRIHKKPVDRFRIFDCSVFCPDCDDRSCLGENQAEVKENRLARSRIEGLCNDFSVFFFVFHSYCEVLFENLKVRNCVLSPRLLKTLKFAKVLNGQDLYNLIQEVSQILSLETFDERKPKRLELFGEVSKKSFGSQVLKVQNEEEFRFCFKVKNHSNMVGVIFAGSFYKYQDSFLQPFVSPPVWISINDDSATVFQFEYFGELQHEKNDIFFNKKVKLIESVEYVFRFRIKGSFLYGKPFTRVKIQGLELSRCQEKTGFNSNPLMGSPFLGFLFEEV